MGSGAVVNGKKKPEVCGRIMVSGAVVDGKKVSRAWTWTRGRVDVVRVNGDGHRSVGVRVCLSSSVVCRSWCRSDLLSCPRVHVHGHGDFSRSVGPSAITTSRDSRRANASANSGRSRPTYR